MSVKDFLFDITPAPIYRAYRWVTERPRAIKWWYQRADGKLPECDMWDYKLTLVDNLCQGLEYLTRDSGVIAWDADAQHKKMYKDLKFALRVFKRLRRYLNTFLILCDTEEEAIEKNRGGIVEYISKKDYEQLEKDKRKAFLIISKYFWGLWD